jgi:hypothetical protein
MFRGGRVSSYGTGIAAPLVPGYQSGGQIGGGIIYGKPMADGRYGFQNPFLPEMKLGKTVHEEALAKPWLSQDLKLPVTTEQEAALELAGDIEGVHIEPEIASYDKETETDEKTSLEKLMENNQWGDQDTTPTEVTIEDKIEAYKKDGDTIQDIIDFSEKANVYIDSEGRKRNASTGKLILRDKEDINLGIETDLAETKLNADQLRIKELENLLADKKEEPTEIDAKAMVAENKALFADLLGIKEARGQDITSMLLGFAGAEGDTTMDKFQKFAAAEAQRPGRRQKVEDAAGTLAIQDYIAGKRSKEQMKALTGKIDYELEGKMKQLIPQTSDSLTEVALKLSRMETSLTSIKGLRALIGTKDKTATGDLVYTLEGIKSEDLTNPKKASKVLKKLKTGYNIMDDEGVKIIIKYDGSGSLNGIERFTISEFWNQKS